MNQETLKLAINIYGNSAQIRMAVEECAELTQVLMHFIRGRATKTEVAGEVADVLIMATQMRLIFGPEAVDAAIDAKMTRLQARMDGAE